MTRSDPSFLTRVRGSTRGRDRLVMGALAALMLAGLLGVATATGWDQIAAQLTRLGPVQIAILLVLSLANYLLRAGRWHLFARRLGLPTSLAQNTRHYLGGFAMSVTPGRLGELVRMRWIGRETSWAFDRTAPLALVDRASDLAAMGVILAIALALSTTGLAGGVPVTLLALAAAYVSTRPTLLAGFATQAHRLTGRLPRLFARLRRAARALGLFSHPRTLGLASFLGIIGWLAEGVAFHLLLVWLGADIGLWTAIAIFIFATLAGGLTGAPGGLGGAEATMIALLLTSGVPLEIGLPATALIRLTTLWFAIGIGLLVFPHAEAKSRKGPHGLDES